MKTTPDLDRVFPLSTGSEPRPSLRPPRLPSLVKHHPGAVPGERAFLHTWTGPRAGDDVRPLTRAFSSPYFTP